MKRFEITSATASISTKPVTKNASGFTLIELLVVIAIIAVLIGLLLPAIQRTREEYAHNEARTKVNQLVIASNEYFNQTGTYALDLNDLYLFCAANSGRCSLDPQLVSGKVNGYLYEIVEADERHCVIEAEPEFPGITGSLTVRAQLTLENTMISSFQTPGADEARERMFNNLRAKAAETVVELLNLDNTAIPQAREYCDSPANVANVCNLLDTNDDGLISISECFSGDAYINEMGLKNPLREFLDYVGQEMKWDSLSDEAKMNIRVDSNPDGDDRTAQPPLFSYDGLAILTVTMVSDGTSNTILIAELLNKLEEAEAAEASGNTQAKMRAINSYQRQVNALVGQCFTRSNGKILITLSKTL